MLMVLLMMLILMRWWECGGCGVFDVDFSVSGFFIVMFILLLGNNKHFDVQ